MRTTKMQMSLTHLSILKLALAALALPSAAYAGNGMYLIGYGAESSLMAGADVAVARDAFAANNNPAGMTQISSRALDIEAALFDLKGNSHSDAFSSYRKPTKNGVGAYGNVAYARRLDNSPYVAGVALVVQGGVGWAYSGMNTAFGTRDDAAGTFSIIKLAPAIAWQMNEQWSLGAALGFNYLAATQELFPNTSSTGPTASPADDFNGFRFKGASGQAITSKWGLQYRPSSDVTIGFTYSTKTSIPLKDGTLRVNYTNSNVAPGLGVVRYDNARLDGMRLPVEWALGVAFRPVSPLLVSLQYKWGDWSYALGKLRLTATESRNPAAPASVTMTSTLAARDLGVVELGFAYEHDPNTTFYAGYNYARHMLPDQNLSPIFAHVYTTHYTFGFQRKVDAEWQAAAGIEVFPVQSRTYDSPLFGPRANERHGGNVLHFGLSRRW